MDKKFDSTESKNEDFHVSISVHSIFHEFYAHEKDPETKRSWDLNLHNLRQLLQIFMAARIGNTSFSANQDIANT
jgi:hypothetical protein